MLWLYFGMAASIQEEVIFRGLLQSFLEQQWVTNSFSSPAVLFTAALFGIVHLGSGAIVLAGAVVLGLVAGELRNPSRRISYAVCGHQQPPCH